jgi:hypothetical protein
MSRTAWFLAASFLMGSGMVGLGGSGSLGGLGQVAVAHAAAGVNQKALKNLMAGFTFGMSRSQVMAKVKQEITTRYDEKIFATSDVYQQDKLRRERDQEIKRIEGSFVEFTGKIAGWDVSVIDDQFVHGTGESMLVYWEASGGRNQRRFFFFHEDRLYKMVITLDASKIDKENRNFGLFRTALEREYGPARDSPQGVVWNGDGVLLFALDKLTHYDTVCLAVTDMKMSRKLLELRAQREKKVDKRSPIIRAMIDDSADKRVDIDKNADTVDRVIKE